MHCIFVLLLILFCVAVYVSSVLADVDERAREELGQLSVGRRVQVGSLLRASAASGQQGDHAPRGFRGEVHVHLQDVHNQRVSGANCYGLATPKFLKMLICFAFKAGAKLLLNPSLPNFSWK